MDNQVWPSGPAAFFQVGGVAAPPTWKKKEAGLRVYPIKVLEWYTPSFNSGRSGNED